MEQRVSLITLGVRDLERSRRFYEALGRNTGAAPSDDVAFFQTGGFIVALWDRAKLAEDSGVQDGGGWGGVTLAYNVSSPREVDAIIEEAREAGSRGKREPRSGEGTPGCSSTSMVTRGRRPTTPIGSCTRTGRSASSRTYRRVLGGRRPPRGETPPAFAATNARASTTSLRQRRPAFGVIDTHSFISRPRPGSK